MATKKYSVEVDPKKVTSVNISRYTDGYNYASISMKVGDNEYSNIHYEWRGTDMPEFVLNVVEIMKTLGMEKAGIVEGQESAYTEQKERSIKYHKELAEKTQ